MGKAVFRILYTTLMLLRSSLFYSEGGDCPLYFKNSFDSVSVTLGRMSFGLWSVILVVCREMLYTSSEFTILLNCD